MKLRILSDLHLEFGNYQPPKVDCDLVVLAGDIHLKLNAVDWIQRTFPEQRVLYVLGNHEYYGEKIPRLVEKLRERCAGTQIQILENDTVEIGGYRFFGATLWSDMQLLGDMAGGAEAALAMNDFKKIRVFPTWKKMTPSDARRFHATTLSKLREFLKVDPSRSVVITHHAPSLACLPEARRSEPVSCAYASNLDALLLENGPKLWVHGHIHDAVRCRIGNTSVYSNPRGYPKDVNSRFEDAGIVDLANV